MNDQPWTNRHLYVIRRRKRSLPRTREGQLTAEGTRLYARLVRAQKYLESRAARR